MADPIPKQKAEQSIVTQEGHLIGAPARIIIGIPVSWHLNKNIRIAFVIASVILPVKGRTNIVKLCLKSIAHQRLSKRLYEVLVIDHSNDEDAETIKKICSATGGSNVQYHHLDLFTNDHVPGLIRNHGADLATGELLIVLDSDCLLYPDCIFWHILNYQYHRFRGIFDYALLGYRYETENNPAWNSFVFDTFGDREMAKLIDELDLEPDLRTFRHLFPLVDKNIKKLSRLPVPGWLYFYSHHFSIPKRTYTAAGGFDLNFTTWGGEDLELGMRLYEKGIPLLFSRRCRSIHQYHPRNHVETKRDFQLSKKVILRKSNTSDRAVYLETCYPYDRLHNLNLKFKMLSSSQSHNNDVIDLAHLYPEGLPKEEHLHLVGIGRKDAFQKLIVSAERENLRFDHLDHAFLTPYGRREVSDCLLDLNNSHAEGDIFLLVKQIVEAISITDRRLFLFLPLKLRDETIRLYPEVIGILEHLRDEVQINKVSEENGSLLISLTRLKTREALPLVITGSIFRRPELFSSSCLIDLVEALDQHFFVALDTQLSAGSSDIRTTTLMVKYHYRFFDISNFSGVFHLQTDLTSETSLRYRRNCFLFAPLTSPFDLTRSEIFKLENFHQLVLVRRECDRDILIEKGFPKEKIHLIDFAVTTNSNCHGRYFLRGKKLEQRPIKIVVPLFAPLAPNLTRWIEQTVSTCAEVNEAFHRFALEFVFLVRSEITGRKHSGPLAFASEETGCGFEEIHHLVQTIKSKNRYGWLNSYWSEPVVSLFRRKDQSVFLFLQNLYETDNIARYLLLQRIPVFKRKIEQFSNLLIDPLLFNLPAQTLLSNEWLNEIFRKIIDIHEHPGVYGLSSLIAQTKQPNDTVERTAGRIYAVISNYLSEAESGGTREIEDRKCQANCLFSAGFKNESAQVLPDMDKSGTNELELTDVVRLHVMGKKVNLLDEHAQALRKYQLTAAFAGAEISREYQMLLGRHYARLKDWVHLDKTFKRLSRPKSDINKE